MHLYRLTHPHPYLETIQRWYEEAFPADERRQYTDLLGLLACPDMHCCALLDGPHLVGFIIYWTLPNVLFVEHLVIAPAHRGQRFGQQALRHVLAIPTQQWLLEVEPPDNALRQRRIQFYERAGFTVAPFPYYQPPYQPDRRAVPLCLMARPAIQTEAEFNHLTALLRRQVYERFYG